MNMQIPGKKLNMFTDDDDDYGITQGRCDAQEQVNSCFDRWGGNW